MTIKLYENTYRIPIGHGLRQGETHMSHKLFFKVLESVLKQMNLEKKEETLMSNA